MAATCWEGFAPACEDLVGTSAVKHLGYTLTDQGGYAIVIAFCSCMFVHDCKNFLWGLNSTRQSINSHRIIWLSLCRGNNECNKQLNGIVGAYM